MVGFCPRKFDEITVNVTELKSAGATFALSPINGSLGLQTQRRHFVSVCSENYLRGLQYSYYCNSAAVFIFCQAEWFTYLCMLNFFFEMYSLLWCYCLSISSFIAGNIAIYPTVWKLDIQKYAMLLFFPLQKQYLLSGRTGSVSASRWRCPSL